MASLSSSDAAQGVPMAQPGTPKGIREEKRGGVGGEAVEGEIQLSPQPRMGLKGHGAYATAAHPWLMRQMPVALPEEVSWHGVRHIGKDWAKGLP